MEHNEHQNRMAYGLRSGFINGHLIGFNAVLAEVVDVSFFKRPQQLAKLDLKKVLSGEISVSEEYITEKRDTKDANFLVAPDGSFIIKAPPKAWKIEERPLDFKNKFITIIK